MKRMPTMIATLALAATAGCATTRAPGGAPVAIEREQITFATGPCFGTCPVYSVVVGPAGEGVFAGQRFTAVTGTRTFALSPAAYRRFAAALAPYRPSGERRVEPGGADCVNAPTDMPSWDVRWSEPSGASDHLTFYGGCAGASPALGQALRTAPELLPIAELIGRR